MRIVHVSDAYAPRIGGLETQVRGLAQQQARAGHEVHVVTATLGRTETGQPIGHGAVEEVDGVKIWRLARKLPGDIPVHPRQNSLLYSTLKTIQPDVVHAHAGMLSPFSFAGIRQSRKLRLPIVVTWHSTFTGWQPVFKAKAWTSRWDLAPIAWTAVGSPGVRHVTRMLQTRRSRSTEVTTLPNGVNLAGWAPSQIDANSSGPAQEVHEPVPPAWREASPKRLRIVATQRLEVRKRTLPLLRAVERARRMTPAGIELELLIVGTGSQDRAVQRWIEKNNATGWVARAGTLTKAQLVELYRHADVFAAPAHLEAFGIAALEARVAGLAVVARSGSGVADFISHRVNGLLTADDQAFGAALAQLATEPGLLARIKRENSQTTPPFDWKSVIQQTDQEYLRAISLRKSA